MEQGFGVHPHLTSAQGLSNYFSPLLPPAHVSLFQIPYKPDEAEEFKQGFGVHPHLTSAQGLSNWVGGGTHAKQPVALWNGVLLCIIT